MKLQVVGLCAVFVAFAGCMGPQRDTPIEVWPDMKRDGKYKPQMESALPMFQDHRASRRPVADTVAREHLDDGTPFFTGIAEDGRTFMGTNPLPLNAETMKLGQAKFNTYCSPCHSRVGDGKGIVAIKTPSWQPSNLHEERIKAEADGEIFNTITNGKRSMPAYRFQTTEHDRWAIVAYLRALQRTSSGAMADVPADRQAGLK